jgi:hypothetical protein
MSSELEQRLEAMLADAPEPDAGAGEEALHRALRALHPVAAPRRGLRGAVLALATVVVLLVIAAGSLGAAGALHISIGAKKQPTTMPLTLPKGASGILAIIDGRLSVVIKGGVRLQGLNVTAAALSPHARFVAAGIGHSLVAIAPDGRRPWTHLVDGRVVDIAWAPDGLRIAYVVRGAHGLALHLIDGDGTDDTMIDGSVRGVDPSWRGNSLAFAYVGAGGKPIVYDIGHLSRRVVETRVKGDVLQVAFAPKGTLLAVATRTQVGMLLLRTGLNQLHDRGQIAGIGWTGRWFAVAHGGEHPVVSLTDNLQLGAIHPGGTIDAMSADGHGIVLAVSTTSGTRVLAAVSGDDVHTVFQISKRATISDLQLG